MRSRLLTLPCVSLAALAVLGLPAGAHADTDSDAPRPPLSGLGGLGPWNAGWLPPVGSTLPTLPSLPSAPSAPAAPSAPSAPSVTELGTGLDASCGRDAVAPEYGSREYPAVITHVPAVTHLAYLWQRTVATTEAEISREAAPATGLYSWSRLEQLVERLHVSKVVVTPAVPAVEAVPERFHIEVDVIRPAVTVTEFEYRHQRTGATRWEDAGWNGEDSGHGDDDDENDTDSLDHGRGWVRTGRTQVVVLREAVTKERRVVDAEAVPGSPAKPAVTEDVLTWVRDGEDGPAGSVATQKTRTTSVTSSTALPVGQAPKGEGWVRGAFTQTAEAQVESDWISEGAAAPEGWTLTGDTRQGRPRTDRTDLRTALAPAGEGWTRVEDSALEVVDVAAYDRVDQERRVEDFIITPGVEATPACPVDEDDTLEEDDLDEGALVVDASGVVAGLPADTPGEVLAVTDLAEVAPALDSAVAPATDVLPATGSPVDGWLLALGLGSVLAGAGLTRRGRRA